jgi:hypothetical protein
MMRVLWKPLAGFSPGQTNITQIFLQFPANPTANHGTPGRIDVASSYLSTTSQIGQNARLVQSNVNEKSKKIYPNNNNK